ncbi:MAG: hypothetical protein FJ148_06605 [Deltaproteobacteria bacterium]|nr:hypothetical protein [Deltaproteobacteria bacterium]
MHARELTKARKPARQLVYIAIAAALLGSLALPGCGDAERGAGSLDGGAFGLVGPHTTVREDTAELVYFYPADVRSAVRWPAVVWLNGASGYTETWNYNELLRSVASWGFIVVGGKSPGRNPAASDERQALLARDADAADVLAGRIDHARIGLAGHSLGAFQTTAATEDYRAAVPIQGGAAAVGRPTLYMTSALDTVVPPASVAAAYDAARGPAWLASHGAADHNAPRLDGGPFREPLIAFLRWQLAGDPVGERWFAGAGCVLCTSEAWELASKP